MSMSYEAASELSVCSDCALMPEVANRGGSEHSEPSVFLNDLSVESRFYGQYCHDLLPIVARCYGWRSTLLIFENCRENKESFF